MEPKRVVIVDDSATMRAVLHQLLAQDDRLEVVGEAADADEARLVIKATNPDVITLDIEMPKMNGLEFLKRLMRLRPMPVVMLSSLTSRGSTEAVQAFSFGAVDCIWKPSSVGELDPKKICSCIFHAAHAHVGEWSAASKRQNEATPNISFNTETDQIILIGASTGGVAALEAVLQELPSLPPPIVIAQHMPEHFLNSFASRLDSILPQDVKMAQHGETLVHGSIRLAPSGGIQTGVSYTNGRWVTQHEEAQGYETFSPSVDHLFFSGVEEAELVVACILTGLGQDGAQAMRALKDRGAKTFGQNEPTCVVYGMPKAAKAVGGVEVEASLSDLPGLMLREIKPRGSG